MISDYLFFSGVLLLSLNLIRFFGFAISDWLFFSSFFFMVLETFTLDKKNNVAWFKNKFLLPAFIIMFGGTISLFQSKLVQVSIYETLQQIYVITVLCSMLWIMIRRGKSEILLKLFIISGVFSASISIIDFIFGTRIGPFLSNTPDQMLWYRYAGTLGSPNKFGFFLVLTILISITFFIREKRKITKLLFGISILIQFAGIYLSGSVTAYIGFIFGLFFIVLVFIKNNPKIPVISIYLLFLTVLFLIFFDFLGKNDYAFIASSNLDVFSRSITRVRTSTSISRIDTYNESINEILKSPIIGVGFDQISTSGININERELNTSIHNALLEIWYSGGFFSLLGYLIIYIEIIKICLDNIRKAISKNSINIIIGLSTASLAAVLMDQFQDTIYQREKWLVFGLLVGFYWNKYKTRRLKNKINN